MDRLGLISFQANDKTDIFHVAEVREDGIDTSDESFLSISDPQFESDRAWVTGKVPGLIKVNIEGDNVFIKAWLKGEKFDLPYTMRIYVEYEEAEELVEVELEKGPDEDDKADLEPQEIHL